MQYRELSLNPLDPIRPQAEQATPTRADSRKATLDVCQLLPCTDGHRGRYGDQKAPRHPLSPGARPLRDVHRTGYKAGHQDEGRGVNVGG